MKKLLSVILSAILILSAFSVTAFAADEPKAEEAIKNFDFEKGVQFEFRIDGIPATTLYVKGDKIASEMNVEGHNLKLILKGDSLYMYFTSFPFIYFKHKDADMPELEEALGTLHFNAQFIEAFEAEYSSETYYVEKYMTDDGGFLEYYFLDDELKIIRSTDGETTSSTEIKIVSTELDDDVFELPFFSFDITPIFELLVSFIEMIM